MYINDNDPYVLHWPMKGGGLNLHSGVGGSLTSVCADLEAIWAHGIKTYLNIPIPSLQVRARIILVVVKSWTSQTGLSSIDKDLLTSPSILYVWSSFLCSTSSNNRLEYS